jgi:hypothetical protein
LDCPVNNEVTPVNYSPGKLLPDALEAMATAVVTEEQLIPVTRKIAIPLAVAQIPY